MDHRYLIAIPLPAEKRAELNALYKDVTGEDLDIQTMHISLEFPLVFNKHMREDEFVQRLVAMMFEPFPITCIRLGVFHQKGKKMLYMKLQPQEKFEELHTNIRVELQEYYLLDTSMYDNGVVPMYDPHLSLKYDMQFDNDIVRKLEEKLRGFTFTAPGITLYKELDKGVWATV